MENINTNKYKEYKEVLLSLSYRELNSPNKFAKSVGKSLFTVELDTLLWSNWFGGADNKIYLFDSEIYEERVHQNFENFILYQETYTRINVGTYSKSFKFLTIEQKLDLML